MKTVLATNRIASRTPTGVERYARELALALHARADVDYRVVVPREAPDAIWTPPPGLAATQVPHNRRLTVALWSTVHRPPVDRYVPATDLVHVAAPTFPIPSTAPTIYTVHDVLPLVRPEWFSVRNRT